MKRTYRSIYQLCYLIALFLAFFGFSCVQSIRSGDDALPPFMYALCAVFFFAGAAALASFAWLKMQKLRKEDEKDFEYYLGQKTHPNYQAPASGPKEGAPENSRFKPIDGIRKKPQDTAMGQAFDKEASSRAAASGRSHPDVVSEVYPDEPPSYNPEDYPEKRDLEEENRAMEEHLKSEE
jgi:hypothetical protein